MEKIGSQKCAELPEAVQMFPCIWDTSLSDHHNSTMLANAWKEVASIMRESGSNVFLGFMCVYNLQFLLGFVDFF